MGFIQRSWRLSFIREWWPYMSLPSIVRLMKFELRNERSEPIQDKTLRLQMKFPVRGPVVLREVGSDILTFTEVIKEQVYKNVTSHVGDCETVIDLGANIGLASLYFANRYPSCRLLAVEPHPGTYGILVRNLKALVDSGRCKTLQAAVWGRKQSLVADPTHTPDHHSAFVTIEAADGQSSQQTMAGLPMLEIIAESKFETIDLLKVDIEGAEVELFSGDPRWLKQVGAIAIEFHKDSRQTSGFDQLMEQYQFSIYEGDPHTVLAIKKGSEVS